MYHIQGVLTQVNTQIYNIIILSLSVRVATIREKCLENEFFSRSGKNRGICGWAGKLRKDLESQGKVGEFEKNSYGNLQKIYFFYSKVERIYFLMR